MPCLLPGKEIGPKILIHRQILHQQTVISNTKEFFSRKRLVFMLRYLLIYLFILFKQPSILIHKIHSHARRFDYHL